MLKIYNKQKYFDKFLFDLNKFIVDNKKAGLKKANM